MPLTSSEMTAEGVSLIVHQMLDGVEVDDHMSDAEPVRLIVEDSDARRTKYSWRVRVRPSREPRRWSHLYEELGLISEKIAEMTGLNILFTADDPAIMVP